MFSVEISGTGRLRLRLEGVRDRSADYRPVFKGSVDRIMRTMFKDIFRTEGGAIRRPWAPYALATVRERKRLGLRRGILRRTDRLLRSLTLVQQPDTVLVIQKTAYERGTKHEAAQYHQRGTKWMPRRVIIPSPVPKLYADQIRAAMAGWVMRGEK